MSRLVPLGLATLLLGAGLLCLVDRSDRPARVAPPHARGGWPGLATSPVAAAAARRAPGGDPAATATPLPTPPVGPDDTSEPSPAVQSLTPSEMERLVAAVGARGLDVLGDDRLARDTFQRLQAAGAWPFDRLLAALGSASSETRVGAAALLLLYGRSEAGRPLSDQLERESDPTARRVLLEALAGLEVPETGAALQRVWEDPKATLAERRTALTGLATLGHPSARALAADPQAAAVERRLAEIGLIRAYRVRGSADPSLRAVIEAMATRSPHEGSRREAAEALAESGH